MLQLFSLRPEVEVALLSATDQEACCGSTRHVVGPYVRPVVAGIGNCVMIDRDFKMTIARQIPFIVI